MPPKKDIPVCNQNASYPSKGHPCHNNSSYPSGHPNQKGGEGGKGGQWGYSGSNSGQNTSNTRYGDNDYLIDLYKKGLLDQHISKINQNIVSTNNQQNISSELVPYFAPHSGKVIGWLEHQNNTLTIIIHLHNV